MMHRRFRPIVVLTLLVAFFSLVSGCTLLPWFNPPVTRYVDASGGDDAADGLTEQTAWASLAKVNDATEPGDTVLFRRGEVYRGQLVPVSGGRVRPTVYGAWGTGTLPELRGSIDVGGVSDWSDAGGGVWTATTIFQTDVGNLIFNDTADFGMKKWALVDLTTQGDYFYDRTDGSLHLYSPSNPGSYYTAIEAAVREHVVDQQGASWVTYEDLAVRFGAAHGFGGGSTQNITIRDCEISYIGGGDLDMDGSNVRFGNGIEFWASARDHVVERNRIWEIYDSALSNQNHTYAVEQTNIVYRNNVIWNCGMSSFEYWNRPAASSTSNIRFEHNTAYGAGDGWGGLPQRPDEVGVHVLLPFSPASAQDIVITNNIFSQGNRAIYIVHGHQWETSLTLNANIYHQDSGDLITLGEDPDNPDETFGAGDLAAWQSLSGLDANSMFADPLLADPANGDLTITGSSPAIDAGLASDVTADHAGASRPNGTAPDIGAYEL